MTTMQVADTLDDMTTTRPPTTAPPQWAPSYGPPARQGAGGRLATLLVGLVALAALVVGIIGLAKSPSPTPASSPAASSPPASTSPAFTADEVATAQNSLCTTWSAASRAVKEETNRTDNPALARVALTNSAAMIDSAAQNPALTPQNREAAAAVSGAYRNLTAVSSIAPPGTPEFQEAVDGANQAARQMQAVCP
ncbi:hypothetical protein H7I77_25345 [Mycolicibacterium novocastrense]|uniref:Alanine and proline rich membrane protein n=1 Tax=Mycolicibacterium novocastrense TaxID=59813 RepID=A0AAW5SRW2_MYCNV|nr:MULTISPECIES: hypothetical protein [Mycolicibacterium]MCV7026636.1 hypothetical protein [Mycolicibacterium novocastrense]MDX1887508.1 hypothetical protein [Mycolicibacterium sp. 120270]